MPTKSARAPAHTYTHMAEKDMGGGGVWGGGVKTKLKARAVIKEQEGVGGGVCSRKAITGQNTV